MQPLLNIQGVHKQFGKTLALEDARLTIQRGKVHALIGQNGAGKSTLIKVLTGVHQRDGGDITFNGQPCQFSRPAQAQDAGIATIYQELNLVGLRSVTENIVMGREPRRLGGFIDWKRAHQQASEILAGLGVDIDVRRPLEEYSTAIQQLVAIARAVSRDAMLVIMDEPTSSLDESEVQQLFEVIRRLQQRGTAVLYVSHFLDELFEICNHVTIMRNGAWVADHAISDTRKAVLVADMLGKDVSDIETHGSTDFGGELEPAGELLFEARDIATRRHLRCASLEVHRGEIVGLAGLLGSGRTEVARAVFGMDALSDGQMSLEGASYHPTNASAAIRQGIALLAEDRKREGIVADLSVRENLTLSILPSLSAGVQIDSEAERKLVEHYIEALQIKVSDMDQPIRELSGGNQQKVLLARWLATEPQLLILDEPTRGVDIGARQEIQRIIQDYRAQGGAVLLISSEFEELIEGAHRVVVMHEGRSIDTLSNPGLTESTLVAALSRGQPSTSGNDHRMQETSARPSTPRETQA